MFWDNTCPASAIGGLCCGVVTRLRNSYSQSLLVNVALVLVKPAEPQDSRQLCFFPRHAADVGSVHRMMPQGKSDLTCIAFTVGTALLAVLQWLQDLRWAPAAYTQYHALFTFTAARQACLRRASSAMFSCRIKACNSYAAVP